MLHIYLIKAPSHTSVNKLKEEKWAMDGFVSIALTKFNTVLIGNDGSLMALGENSISKMKNN